MIVVDAGNTRIKWAQVDNQGQLSDVHATTHAGIEQSALKTALKQAGPVVVANVAGEPIAAKLTAMLPPNQPIHFLTPQAQACHVINGYDQAQQLGIDRWAAVIAAWHLQQCPCIVINAGTAITIDLLTKDKASPNGLYLGGSIMPGLQLMLNALADKTANLMANPTGMIEHFPKNTQNAIYTGCMDAIVGAVVLKMKQLEKNSTFLPKVVVSGGDAVKIMHALNPHISRVIKIENLVLQGLVLLGEEVL